MSEISPTEEWSQAVGSSRPAKLKDKIDLLERRLGELFVSLFHTYTKKAHFITPFICLYADYNYKTGLAIVKLWPHDADKETGNPTSCANLAVEFDMDRFFSELSQVVNTCAEEGSDDEDKPVEEINCSIDRSRVLEADRPHCNDENITELTEFSLTATPPDLLRLADEFMRKHKMFDEDIPVQQESLLDRDDSDLLLRDDDMGPAVLHTMPLGVYLSREMAVTAGYANQPESGFVPCSLLAIEALIHDIANAGTRPKARTPLPSHLQNHQIQ